MKQTRAAVQEPGLSSLPAEVSVHKAGVLGLGRPLKGTFLSPASGSLKRELIESIYISERPLNPILTLTSSLKSNPINPKP